MSIQYCDNYPENAPDNIIELIEKFTETSNEKYQYMFFRESELLALLDVCKSAEHQKEREIDNATEWGLSGFSLVSDDRAQIEAMIEAKKENGRKLYEYAFGSPVSDKEAWKKYQDYCFEQRKLYPLDSKERIYYEREITKCQAELDLL